MAKKNDYATPGSKAFAILSYPLVIVSLVWYMVDEEVRADERATIHFKQGLVLNLGALVFLVAASIVDFMIGKLIPFIDQVLTSLIGIGWLIFVIIGAIYAANCSMKRIIVVSDIAKNLKF